MLDLPEWLDRDLFNEWVEWRKESSKKKLTDKSLNRIIKIGITKLKKLKKLGHDPNLSIEETIFNEWKGFWPPKANYEIHQPANSGVGHRPLSRQDQFRAELDGIFTGAEAFGDGPPEVKQLGETLGREREGEGLVTRDSRFKSH